MNGAEFTAPSPIALFCRIKLRLAANHLKHLKRHILVHIVVVSGVMMFLLLGGYLLFAFMFDFLLDEKQQPFGEPLMRRLIGMILLAFFSMLTFSNLIIMLTTSYISREVEFYIGQPISYRRLFFCKLGESTVYSSWAFTVLSFPFFIALGATGAARASWEFYVLMSLMIVPYILIPSALGAIATLLLTAFIPAKKMFRLAAVLAVLTLFSGVLMGRLVGINQLFKRGGRDEIARIMNFMGVGDVAWIPSTWLARGIRSSLEGNWTEVLFWNALLVSTALMTLLVCYWLSGPLYYRGFCAARATGGTRRTRSGGLYAFFDLLVRPLRPPIRALVVKDLSVFWRDPAQWGQLVILFGLLFIYIVNLGSGRELSRIRENLPIWQSVISLVNIGATCFVLSILTTRFVYPMLSLEGKQHWVIGLAPLKRTRLVWVKYGVCWTSSLFLTVPLILLSCRMLETDPFITALSLVTVVTMSMGLNSLAIGLGALMPNFQEDNPSRIANGLGGTLNVILSMIYIGTAIGLETPLLWAYVVQGQAETGVRPALVYSALIVAVFVHLTTIVLPMVLGLRHWRRLEF